METKLSIVVPLYNESQRLIEGLEAIRDYMDARDFSCETIVVDDGSTDDTVRLVQEHIGQDKRFRLVTYQRNQGKGYAVKKGMLEAVGEVRLFTDIDMSVPIDRADDFLKKVEEGNDIVIGTRKSQMSNVIIHQPKYREILGEGYRRFVRILFAPGISDFTCGFKAFSAQAATKVFSASLIKRWSFDTELLFLARRWGLSILEVPVSWTNSPATKVNLILDVARSGFELFMIRWNWIKGRYKN